MLKKTIFPYELIGEEIEVLDSSLDNYNGLRGMVVDETKMTIRIQQSGKIKTLLKNKLSLRLCRSGRILTGSMLARRPEERIKGR